MAPLHFSIQYHDEFIFENIFYKLLRKVKLRKKHYFVYPDTVWNSNTRFTIGYRCQYCNAFSMDSTKTCEEYLAQRTMDKVLQ